MHGRCHLEVDQRHGALGQAYLGQDRIGREIEHVEEGRADSHHIEVPVSVTVHFRRPSVVGMHGPRTYSERDG